MRRAAGMGAVALVLVLGCSGDDAEQTEAPEPTASTTSTSPPRPTTTTSTIYAPGTVEAEVEAAYLRSWEVYSEAVYNLVLDEEALASVYAGNHLDTARREIQGRIRDKRAALFATEHQLQVRVVDADSAVVIDEQVNHQVLIDAGSKRPIESDPNEKQTVAAAVEGGRGAWRVTSLERLP